MNKISCKRIYILLSVMLVGLSAGFAQSEYFTYGGEGGTIITGLTDAGVAATSLTIPKEVTTVKAAAFSYASNGLSTLVIEEGGNPAFEGNLFGGRTDPLGDIEIMGSSMTVANIRALLTSLVEKGNLSTVYIDGYSGDWTDIGETNVLTAKVYVILPAEKVTTQQFGSAKVMGRFVINKEIITFCTNATFRDDGNNNMLFYVADRLGNDGRLHIQRVSYIVAGKGVLIHRSNSSSGYCDLERYDGNISSDDEYLYNSNMLVGVTTETPIEKTDGDKTNYILKDGAFHPTSGGTLKANRAYLQIPTSSAPARPLSIDFDDETTDVPLIDNEQWTMDNDAGASGCFDLQGRKVVQPTRGLYIKNGKKYFIR